MQRFYFMQVDYLIIGQGICGSFLSHFLQQNNCSFIVIDENKTTTSSKVASSVINPITGRRLVRTWMIEEVMPVSVGVYKDLEKKLNTSLIKQKNIIDFFTTPQMKLAFEERLITESEYLCSIKNEQQFDDIFNQFFGMGMINQCWWIDLNLLLNKLRIQLQKNNQLLTEKFNINELLLTNESVYYKDIEAKKIIFCDGIGSTENKWFKLLPFAPNKGEALLVKIDGLSRDFMYKCGVSIVPWQDDLFWVGSTYEWKFSDDRPTTLFREKTKQTLEQILKIPFTVVDHLCAVRPANVERRPFVGFHPIQKNVGILNGMGTKGCSLAPYFAQELVNNLLHQTPINPLADIKRFERILSREN